ncbi:hypothetical protein T02_2947 [Trichinella nativa]|uniref:Uncharacterized protein n=1 Tax=Trichinella nativa TaxID=6335 RepID=A0A0V1LS19_9BILA|nr:hypothetical protein T02_2947 [Trichinella nativa]
MILKKEYSETTVILKTDYDGSIVILIREYTGTIVILKREYSGENMGHCAALIIYAAFLAIASIILAHANESRSRLKIGMVHFGPALQLLVVDHAILLDHQIFVVLVFLLLGRQKLLFGLQNIAKLKSTESTEKY